MFLSFTLADLQAIESLANVADTVPAAAAYPLDIVKACRAVDEIVKRLRAEAAERDAAMDAVDDVRNDIEEVRAVYPAAVSVVEKNGTVSAWIDCNGTTISGIHSDRFAAWADAASRVRRLGKPVTV